MWTGNINADIKKEYATAIISIALTSSLFSLILGGYNLSGIYEQQSDNGIDGYYTYLFKDGRVYTGLKGQTEIEIIDNEYGVGRTGGIKY